MVKYYIIIGIIYTIPYIVTIVISGLRKKLETDRNFYGKTIDIQKIELTNVSYKKFEIVRNNIKKYTEMGEIKYVYDRSYDFEDERLLLSELDPVKVAHMQKLWEMLSIFLQIIMDAVGGGYVHQGLIHVMPLQ